MLEVVVGAVFSYTVLAPATDELSVRDWVPWGLCF